MKMLRVLEYAKPVTGSSRKAHLHRNSKEASTTAKSRCVNESTSTARFIVIKFTTQQKFSLPCSGRVDGPCGLASDLQSSKRHQITEVVINVLKKRKLHSITQRLQLYASAANCIFVGIMFLGTVDTEMSCLLC
jgi:hypothetical protein